MSVANFKKRVVAYIIDLFLSLAIPVSLFVIFFSYMASFPWISWVIIVEVAAWFCFSILVSAFAYICNGFSFGGLLLGVKIVEKEGKRLTYRNALIRSILLGVLPIVLLNACYMLIIHSERTIMDKMTNTYSIDSRIR